MSIVNILKDNRMEKKLDPTLIENAVLKLPFNITQN